MTDEPRLDPAPGRPTGLADLLRSAREARSLSVADVAELTHVRQEYLRALEDGRYGDLPEDVYARNFVRLFAQAVGVDPERALSAYQTERRQAGGLSTLEMRLEKERAGEKPPRPKRKRTPVEREPRGFNLGTFVPTLLLVAALVGLAVWGFNRLMSPARPVGTSAPPITAPSTGGQPGGGAADTPAAADPAAETTQPRTVIVSVLSDPPGATVSIDSFALPGVTPVRDVPVTARAGRVLDVRLEGYEPLMQTVDILEDQVLEVNLAPLPAAVGVPDGGTEEPVAAAGQLRLEVTAPTWLEVYTGTVRNQGERLVYRTAQEGETFSFDLPVYVHVGNAAGVNVTVGGTAVGALGSSGAVTGRAFTGP